MEQFSLEKYLENTSRKVVTRDGRAVRIVCWDVKGLFPILALIMGNGERDTKVGEEYPCCYKVDGTCPVSDSCDLFFADEEEGLTELQITLEEDCDCYVDLYNNGKTKEELRTWIRAWIPRIIDLARKELENNNWKQSLRYYKDAYEQGKLDALKDLPKWKKATGYEEFDNHILLFEDENRVVITEEIYKDEYYIELEDLKTLPKEE